MLYDGDDAVEAETVEGVLAHGAGGFGGVALAPETLMEDVPDLDFLGAVKIPGEESAATAEHPVLAWPGEETAEQTAPESEEGLWGRSRDFDWGD